MCVCVCVRTFRVKNITASASLSYKQVHFLGNDKKFFLQIIMPTIS